MLSAKWRRPSTSQNRRVWHHFERIRNGKKLQFEVQDVTEDLQESVLCLMKQYYMREEPWSASAGVADDSNSLKMYEKFVREYIFTQNMSLVCILRDEHDSSAYEIVGFNLLVVSSIENKNELDRFKNQSKNLDTLFNINDEFKKLCPDLFQKYNVDKYLYAYGLCVHPDYRGLGISVEILKTRVPLMKSMGISLTSTEFTTTASQKSAYEAGFKIDVSITYDELEKRTGKKFGCWKKCEMMSMSVR